MEPIKRDNIKINAEGLVLGRLATQIARILMGKTKTTYLPYTDCGDFVTVSNVDKIKITGKKIEQKVFYHHTGYLGGLKSKSLKEMIIKNPAEVLRLAVFGMLPKNRLRARMIKRLKFE